MSIYWTKYLRYGLFLDHEKHYNQFINDLLPKYNKNSNIVKNLDQKVQRTSIFLLDFFKKFLEEDCKCEEIKVGKNEKNKNFTIQRPIPKECHSFRFLCYKSQTKLKQIL